MANVKLKEKTAEGYRTLYPSTLAKNVITGTGNVQSDISKLMSEINDLKGSDFLDWGIDCAEMTEEELNIKFLEAVKSKKKVKVYNFSFPTTPVINLGNGFLKFEYFEDELQTVKVEFVKDALNPNLITGAVRYINLLGWDEDTEEYYEVEEIAFLNYQQWQIRGGYVRFNEKQVTEQITGGTGGNKYLKSSDFNSDIVPSIFKEIVLNVIIKATNGVSGTTETTYRQFIIKRPETYDMFEYINFMKNGRVDILFTGFFTPPNLVMYRVGNTGNLVSGSVTLSIKPVGYFY
ncbi:hypothetical protein [Sebaldella sp. S0638]|uniref:hypothetical protein n=1 Tax=Sebaldella sp. S0638 TaxID=2957809 RepID=UPI0020A02FBF|nr:hypothetical protein [Sebaldella sp. S0638]MCP1225680.1 hypothetical protein [Sebaldella sp. S0638]